MRGASTDLSLSAAEARVGRRTVLVGLGASCATLGMPRPAASVEGEALKTIAAGRGLTYGCAVFEKTLRDDARMREAVLREVASIVAGYEMKWRPTAPAEGRADYRAGDELLRFATDNGLALRGHTVVWHQNPPLWAIPRLHGREGEELVFAHIRDIMGHYRGRVREWDVVNEAVNVPEGRPDGLRRWGPYERGYDFLADCFRVAHEADPDAVLCYNDFGLEYDRIDQAAKRAAVLRLVEALKARGAPIHAVGIQSHLIAWYPFSQGVFRKFLADLAGLDLRIRLTELDMNERKVGGDIGKRDRFGASLVRRYLDAALDEKAVTGVLTWGLSDSENWLTGYAPRLDGLPQRSMPLDEAFERKPIWYALASAFRNAPSR
ncbi:endo-1,4-beta-xylanase [Aureimonas leprariae]|uniref:Beta-xylanase n=1 Tax=Plantimonas leprariae TaxID=2615207 RepID=A0A7V7TX26_9HYPH|nr:endo-1,4-beta-xylanase [Aureimonas leprariae]KAB0680294.1 endo-1,4-beta-xylanase [Aureimonas leprariae]